jgi:hypothetical protein
MAAAAALRIGMGEHFWSGSVRLGFQKGNLRSPILPAIGPGIHNPCKVTDARTSF